MHGSSGADVCEVLWKFFIDVGGFLKMLQFDFDLRLIGGKTAALLRSMVLEFEPLHLIIRIKLN